MIFVEYFLRNISLSNTTVVMRLTAIQTVRMRQYSKNKQFISIAGYESGALTELLACRKSSLRHFVRVSHLSSNNTKVNFAFYISWFVK